MSDLELPFGTTEVEAEDLRALIDFEQAVKLAADGNVTNPSMRLGQFVEAVPGLLEWLSASGRTYPWRWTTDPWEVYIAEILLQRTRGDAVADVYETFISQFPDPRTLHQAREEQIRDVVSSLGFTNHRVRTLKEVSELVVTEYSGNVPDSVEELQKPWRVGEYTARAVQIFSRGRPLGLVDVNFARIIERALGYEMPNQPHKSRTVYAFLDSITPRAPGVARAFNLAMLDLGALVCTSSGPACDSCPLSDACLYFEEAP
jgi:A/G-specific adenine glycosylase